MYMLDYYMGYMLDARLLHGVLARLLQVHTRLLHGVQFYVPLGSNLMQ